MLTSIFSITKMGLSVEAWKKTWLTGGRWRAGGRAIRADGWAGIQNNLLLSIRGRVR